MSGRKSKQSGVRVSGPISPKQAQSGAAIPEVVFDVLNALLSKGATVITQKEVVRLLVAKGVSRHKIFEEHYLDFEGAYRKKGWEVYYDKPGYNETYDAYWRFSR